MGHLIPLHGATKNDARLHHRQSMVAMARTIDAENAIVAGFRPQYMELQLVRFGHAELSLLDKTQSERQKQKRKAKAKFRELFRRHNGY